MINNTLVELFKSLNKSELRQFHDFLNSPFFNRKKQAVDLFNYLKDFYPDFDDVKKLDRKNVYMALYPGKPYNYGIMKNIIYELNLLGEKFLEIICYSENKSDQWRNLLTQLTERNLNKSFKKNLKKAELLIQRGTGDDAYFRYKMDIELLKFNYHIKNIGRIEKPKFDLNASKYLISFFLIKFFKINYNFLVHNVNFGVANDFRFLDEVLNYINKTPDVDSVILLYYKRFMLMYKENDTTYREFKKLVKEQFKHLARKEQFNTYNNLLNYCYGKIVSGESGYYKELFNIYNEMISNNIITVTENDYFDAVHFRLAAETGAILKKFEWTENFIKQFSEKLHPKIKANEINFAFAYYFFMRKNYDKAQHHLAQIHLHTAYDKVYLYIIQSMLLYETRQFENLISEVDSIRHFAINNKLLAAEHRNYLMKYVRYLNDLVRLKMKEHDDNEVGINKIKEILSSENGILEKNWLLEKLEELSGKKVQNKLSVSV